MIEEINFHLDFAKEQNGRSCFSSGEDSSKNQGW